MNQMKTTSSIPRSSFLTPPGHKQLVISCKYIDDNITAVPVDLKTNLVCDESIPLPPVYHSRTGHSLPDEKNPLISQVKNIIDFSYEYQMQINTKKTNVMLFTRSRSRDFQPEIYINNELLDVVETTKLLGVIISSNMKWDHHVEYIRNKAMKSLWMIRRVKEVGGTIEDMLTVYTVQIRCLTETACQIWNGSLTTSHVNTLERVQKSAFRIILGQNYVSYAKTLKLFELQTLAERRKELCISFAKKAAKDPKFKIWFSNLTRSTRTDPNFALPKTRTATYEKSPHIYLNLIEPSVMIKMNAIILYV